MSNGRLESKVGIASEDVNCYYFAVLYEIKWQWELKTTTAAQAKPPQFIKQMWGGRAKF
jgi:hypothetical protein